MNQWFTNPFRDEQIRSGEPQPAGPNRAQRRAAEQEKRRKQRRGQRAYERGLRERGEDV